MLFVGATLAVALFAVALFAVVLFAGVPFAVVPFAGVPFAGDRKGRHYGSGMGSLNFTPNLPATIPASKAVSWVYPVQLT
ncbi:hypothetical protein EZS27_001366 [termite gut metagenome]|uniref:Uncharacterized protein n=1 Tax=termite gut metagenome TaxID=433724 RepID=A0A5J4T150_9ZZZZ